MSSGCYLADAELAEVHRKIRKVSHPSFFVRRSSCPCLAEVGYPQCRSQFRLNRRLQRQRRSRPGLDYLTIETGEIHKTYLFDMVVALPDTHSRPCLASGTVLQVFLVPIWLAVIHHSPAVGAIAWSYTVLSVMCVLCSLVANYRCILRVYHTVG